jgi:peptidoglycan/LPS O-acetylase OafA/YrhL
MAQDATGRNLTSIQILRGIAALLVVFHHYVGTSVQRGFAIPGLEGAAVGNAGVDIFFVISGFIMEYTVGAHAYRGGDRTIFIVRRIIRIVPLYWVLTTVAFLAAVFWKGAITSRPTTEQFLWSLILLPGVNGIGHVDYVIPMAWTLAYEFYFYAIFACLLGVSPKVRLVSQAIIFFASTLIGSVFAPASPLLGMVTNPLLFEFLVGCLLAQLVRSGWALDGRLATGLIVAASTIFVFELKRDTSDSVVRLLIWGVPAAMLVYGAVLGKREARSMLAMAFGHIGDISYSLYLSHFFVIALFAKLYSAWATTFPISPWMAAIALFGLCLLGAQFCYALIERPSRIWLQQRFDAYRRRSSMLKPPETVNPG